MSDKNLRNEKIIELKTIFSNLENYYHGTSSGLDPLICYLNLPILIKSKNNLGTVGIPSSNNGKEQFSYLTQAKLEILNH